VSLELALGIDFAAGEIWQRFALDVSNHESLSSRARLRDAGIDFYQVRRASIQGVRIARGRDAAAIEEHFMIPGE
jgi:hypothetical protein